MEHKKVEKQIRDTFNQEVPDVLSKIKASPDFHVPKKKRSFDLRNLLNMKTLVSFTSIFILSLVLITGFTRNSNVVASTVTLELNPSITISLNKRDYVVNVTAANDDGEEVIDRNVKYRGLTVDKVLEIIIERLNELGYVVDSDDLNNIILIEVNSNNDERKERLKNNFEDRIQLELEKYNKSHWVFDSEDFKLTNEQLNQIKEHRYLQRMSTTKLALIFRINTLEPSHSIEDLSKANVRDLYDLFLRLEDPNNLPERHKMPDPKDHRTMP